MRALRADHNGGAREPAMELVGIRLELLVSQGGAGLQIWPWLVDVG